MTKTKLKFKFFVKTIPGWIVYLYCNPHIFCLDLDLLAHFIIKNISKVALREKPSKISPSKASWTFPFFPFFDKFQDNKWMTCQRASESSELPSPSSEKRFCSHWPRELTSDGTWWDELLRSWERAGCTHRQSSSVTKNMCWLQYKSIMNKM